MLTLFEPGAHRGHHARHRQGRPGDFHGGQAVALKEGKQTSAFTGTTQDFKIPVGGGAEVDARAYIPAGTGPFPTVLYIHGGGWVIASLEAYDASPRTLCELTKSVFISVNYRLAPEYKFPRAR